MSNLISMELEKEKEKEKCRQVIRWEDMKKDEKCESMESCSSLSESAEEEDDATTSSSSSSSSSLFEFTDLMAQLPIKRGLSKFYNGRSESFGSLRSVESVEDLKKKERQHSSKRMKVSKSYGNRHSLSPNPTIAKRSSSPNTINAIPLI
ncbi:protein OXIDATIVE STRESS 3 LIKE 2-like [Salvia hispanica]|uniref:protein OXIDATIVE STRESS 3 LIKE 2-like n=1 Tax=Salvia hispanica TaxID=49212 RepID=UPI002009C191|nr:protein OXIDATIVE STRESS 3 LIKE 2-like [Salvia hispanica]